MANHAKHTILRKRNHSKRKGQGRARFKQGILLLFCAFCLCAGGWLWHEALTSGQTARIAVEDDFRPQVGDPPYRVAVDAGHGGSDPGAQGVVNEAQMNRQTAQALVEMLEADPNYIPLNTRDSYDTTAKPGERAAYANTQSPQLLLSIHGNSASEGSSASGFECYPAVPGRTWHRESFYFAELLAAGMQNAGSHLRGRGGVRYLYYQGENKLLVESNHTEERQERSFTILEDVNCPAVLAEQCFVTNEADVAQFGSEEGCRRVAQIYYEAICGYFGTQPLGSS